MSFQNIHRAYVRPGPGLLLAAFVLLSQACGGAAPGSQPHDMSAAQHEAAASQHEQTASSHEAQHDPGATSSRERCRSATSRGNPEPICWTSEVNPTAQHRRDSEEHHKIAEQHRAAAEALRKAEASACGGISDEDRDTSPFYHREDIARAEPIKSEPPARGGGAPALKGATVVFRAVPGLTAEWLQRVVTCHLARNAVVGHDAKDMAYCPLALKDVTATVTSTGDGFAIAVRSDDPDTAKEILRRAEALPLR